MEGYTTKQYIYIWHNLTTEMIESNNNTCGDMFCYPLHSTNYRLILACCKQVLFHISFVAPVEYSFEVAAITLFTARCFEMLCISIF